MKLLKSPWDKLLFDCVSFCNESVKITSPYVKRSIVENIIKNKRKEVSLTLVTQFKLMNFYKKSSDLDALEIILNENGNVINYQKIHSKIYIFDNRKAVVTSGNLTFGGLINNYEYGVFIDGQAEVDQITKDFDDLCINDNSGKISLSEIKQAKDIIAKIPETKPIILPQIENNKGFDEIDVYSGGIATITASLTGWKLEVFNSLIKIPKSVFTLQDVNKFAPELRRKYPDNNNVEAKVRQQLQFLRDIGLIMFLGNGVYRKLWN